MKALESCQWVPRWVSHLGCVKGCLEFMGIEVSEAWLYGGTGHAFVINVHEGVCPSGPTAWKTVRLFQLGHNLGYSLDSIFGFRHNDDFAGLQERAWIHTREAIDQGRPCFGWELEIPEFYVISGYDDRGYYYSGPGCDDGTGPKPWQELGRTGIGIVELYSLRPGEAADDRTTVRQALTFALEHAANPEEWIFEHYGAGLAGFENWIGALKAGKASDMGVRYNAGVWFECRRNAVGFLQEARERLAGQADAQFDHALAHYTVVSENLGKVAQIYGWVQGGSDEDLLPVDDRSRAAVEALRAAKGAEAAGLQALAEIIQVLGD